MCAALGALSNTSDCVAQAVSTPSAAVLQPAGSAGAATSSKVHECPSADGAAVAIASAQISLPPLGVRPSRVTAPVFTSSV